MTQVFIDTIIVCFFTGITIVMGSMSMGELDGVALTTATFELFLVGAGGMILAIRITLFEFSTIPGCSYYGKKASVI